MSFCHESANACSASEVARAPVHTHKGERRKVRVGVGEVGGWGAVVMHVMLTRTCSLMMKARLRPHHL